LQNNIAPIIASSTFQNSGLLVIIFDKSELNDLDHGGGQVPAVIVSPIANQIFSRKRFISTRAH
jgi:hypothetical protein